MSIIAFLGGIGILELLFITVFVICPIILWIWAIIDLLNSKFSSDTNKIIWALVVLLLPLLGTILYLTIGRKQKLAN